MNSLRNNSNKFLDDVSDNRVNSLFIETSYYNKAVDSLEHNNNIVILIGIPGIGKTTTSKKISRVFKEKGFKIYYSEEGLVEEITQLINESISDEKVLIVLNDFLGQFYTEKEYMKEKSGVAKLIMLINAKSKGNIKLLMNTRSIIYDDAKQNEKFNSAISNDVCEIKMDNLDFLDRANIFHIHLKKAYELGKLSKEHWHCVIENKNYVKIIYDKNFNPRIIEHVTNKDFLLKVNPQDYVNKIFDALENPSKVWKEEYEKLEEEDQICLNTLFSLTNTNVPINLLIECFNNRPKVNSTATTKNHFQNSINRLSESIVNVIESNGIKRIGVINPSINDFLRNYLAENETETDEIIKYSIYFEQIDRIMPYKKMKSQLVSKVTSGLLDNYLTFPKQVFSNIKMEYSPPKYLYLLKILLIYIGESDLKNCSLNVNYIQDLILSVFEERYDNIEANSRLYFAFEFSEIFIILFKRNDQYDFSEIVKNEKRFNVVLNSISRHEKFWDVLNDIQEEYFSDNKKSFYKMDNVKSCVAERIKSEVINETYNKLLNIITSATESHYDDLNDGDVIINDVIIDDVIIDDVINDINDDILDLIRSSIEDKLEKLEKYGIKYIDIDDDRFDADTIITDDIDVISMIEDEFNKRKYVESVEFKENIQKPMKNIIDIYEDTSWLI